MAVILDFTDVKKNVTERREGKGTRLGFLCGYSKVQRL